MESKLKKSFKKIISPLLLAGSLIGASTKTADAQDFRIPLGLDFLINNPNIPISCNDRVFLNHINRINYITASRGYQPDFDYNNQRQREIVIRHVHENYSVKDGKVDPNSISQVFTANYYKDFNENGFSSLDEFVGFNKKEFKSNERIMSGIYLPIRGIKGKILTMKTFNPMGKELWNSGGEIKIPSDNYVKCKRYNPDDLLNDHGEGTYTSAFYINEKFFDKVDFRLTDVESSDEDKRWRADRIKRGTYIGRWVDLNNDGKFEWNELLDKGKTEIIEGKSITFGHHSKNYNDRETYGIKIYSSSEEKIIYSNEVESTPGLGQSFHYPNRDKREELIPGEYTAIYELNGEVRDKRNFKIVPNKKDETNPRIIIEPLGVFDNRP